MTVASRTPVPAPTAGGARRRRLGIMGGTFDPIHHGHLVAASEVAAEFELDEVVFVPTGQPWQKSDRQVSPAEDRYLMTVVATASNPRFTVSRVDIDRPGVTYTVDTLRDLRRLHPDAELFFITGADALAQILSWKDVGELWDLAHFIGVTRPGWNRSALVYLDTSSVMVSSPKAPEPLACTLRSGMRSRLKCACFSTRCTSDSSSGPCSPTVAECSSVLTGEPFTFVETPEYGHTPREATSFADVMASVLLCLSFVAVMGTS